jgi:hypothetical protein
MNSCNCIERAKHPKDRNWAVTRRNYNCSAFNGYKRQFSDYSSVECKSCGRVWRTNAEYVDQLKDAA